MSSCSARRSNGSSCPTTSSPGWRARLSPSTRRSPRRQAGGRWETSSPGTSYSTKPGQPTLVVAATTPMLGRPCRAVLFSDGQRIVADAVAPVADDRQERPQTWTLAARRFERQTRSRGRSGSRRDATITCRSPVRSSIRPRLDLPIEPYTFGAWLGDGTTTKAEITSVDPEVLEQISGDGFSVRPMAYAPHLYRIGGVGHTRDARTGRYDRERVALQPASSDGSASGQVRSPRVPGGRRHPADRPAAGSHGLPMAMSTTSLVGANSRAHAKASRTPSWSSRRASASARSRRSDAPR